MNNRLQNVSAPERYDVISCRISRATMETAVTHTIDRVDSKRGGYVCFTNVHAAVMGRQDRAYRAALDNSYMTLPDGKPLFWVARLKKLSDVGHVPGPDFFPAFLERTADKGLRHYFFGSKPDVLSTLEKKLTALHPEMQIVGSYSPPFREVSREETKAMIADINRVQPDVVWIGLGAPKQEFWMADNWEALRPAILMGVGAAFDFHAGTVKRAPRLFTRVGLEWLYRLCREPRRLWRRYFVTNSLFIYFLGANLLLGREK